MAGADVRNEIAEISAGFFFFLLHQELRAKNRKSLKAARQIFAKGRILIGRESFKQLGARVPFLRPTRLLAPPVAINPMPGVAHHSRGPMRQVYLRAAAGISLPHCGREVRSVRRASVHKCTDAGRPPKSSKFVQDRPTRKTPFRLAGALRISFRLRDIRSGPRRFGESKSLLDKCALMRAQNTTAVHYLQTRP